MTLLKDILLSLYNFKYYRTLAQRKGLYVFAALVLVSVISFGALSAMIFNNGVKESATYIFPESGYAAHYRPHFTTAPGPEYMEYNRTQIVITKDALFYYANGLVTYRALNDGEDFFTLIYNQPKKDVYKAILKRALMFSAALCTGVIIGSLILACAVLFATAACLNRAVKFKEIFKMAVFILFPFNALDIAMQTFLPQINFTLISFLVLRLSGARLLSGISLKSMT